MNPDLAGQTHELKEKGAHLLYAGTAETPVRIRLIDTDRIEAGSTGYAQLELRDPMPLIRGDRFVLRDAGRVLTLGGGLVLDPWPTRGPRDNGLSAYLASISTSDPDETLRSLVEAEGSIPSHQALLRTGATGPASGPGIVTLGTTFVSSGRMDELSDRLRAEVALHHEAQPLRRGIDREDLRARLGIDDRPMFDALVSDASGIVHEGPLIRLQEHSVALDPQQQTERADLFARLESAELNPPLAKELQVSPALLRSLIDSGDIVPIGDFFLTAAQTKDVKQRIIAFIETNGPATVAQIRDELETSRKYAVPLCEWLDQNGITRRQGNDRVLGPRASG